MKYSIIALFTLCIVSCAQNGSKEKESLNDDLFILKNISSSDLQQQFYLDDTSAVLQLYVDSTMKKKFIKMDSLQKAEYLAPAIGLPPQFVAQDQDAYFISRQPNIGENQVIIMETSGTDYAAMVLATIGKNGKVISGYILSGGQCGGPGQSNDGKIVFCPNIQSTLNNDEIRSGFVTIRMHPDSESVPAIVDSVTYLAKIGTDGKITRKRIDSSRYRRLINW